MKNSACHLAPTKGFTLIEMAVVLVIIGLVVGGVLVGRNLIDAAAVRATISQIEKFDSAANTFRDKYGYLPGDIPDPFARSFGLQARGNNCGNNGGQGDGNGLLQGQAECTVEGGALCGEGTAFWVDLVAANLIEGGFNTMLWNGLPTLTNVASYFPQAKIGPSNYIYVWEGGYQDGPYNWSGDRYNYYGIAKVSSLNYWQLNATPGLTVQQAYNIDQKIDDGLPQSGRVMDLYWHFDYSNFSPLWAGSGGVSGSPYTTATAGSTSTCYDNSSSPSGTPGIAGAQQHYSIEMNGNTTNCALSIRMQAGD